MVRYDEEVLKIVKRLQNARLSLLQKQPFYALLLMNMKFSLDETCETVYTDGIRIAFNPDFLKKIDEGELEFVLMHTVLHTALCHPFRMQADYDLKAYDKACDIVVNSNILQSFNMDLRKISIKDYGVAIHNAPDGTEGFEYTVEQVYDMLMEHKPNKNAPSNNNNNDEGEAGDGEGEAGDGEGGDEGGEGDNEDNGDGDGNGNSKAKGKSKENGDSNADGSDIEGKGKENSKSKKKKEITKKDLKSLVASIKQDISKNKEKYGELKESDEKEENKEFSFDDHSFWRGDDEIQSLRQTWEVRIMNTVESLFSSEGGNGRGTVPKAAERIIAELKNPVIDWRTVLNDFVQEEITDYSFAPPDKRMEDCPFFLPDFNEKDENVKDILFMVDTSGSMSDIAITECYSEIYGAIQQFNGKLQGKLGFFDAVVVEPIAFEDEEEFKIIRPKGGGGTSFDIIFQYVNEQMQDEPPVSIVILTDGYAPFPNEEDANGIPVLWIINNENATPPWGKVARLLTK